ncbi:hypothetical protein FRUB_00648 [Fimbriiglobus ruber]|uniref:Uncharacterized protein n=1 Tax=Fimbriiglobus ruber TaxID=1908690 RepID=A0A225EC90_9BACT|nr:hypothetical protein FRUB_00648 [Fimbriiglobus ruber]
MSIETAVKLAASPHILRRHPSESDQVEIAFPLQETSPNVGNLPSSGILTGNRRLSG